MINKLIKGLKDIHELSRDYYESCEESIPYQRLGFSSLHSFLQSIPSGKYSFLIGQYKTLLTSNWSIPPVCRVIEMGHSVYVEGVADKVIKYY